MKLIECVNHINRISPRLYDYEEMRDFAPMIDSHVIDHSGTYDFMGYGGNCIVFEDQTHVIKICKQDKKICEEFLTYCDRFDFLPLLRVDNVLYMSGRDKVGTNHYMVYRQIKCQCIEDMNELILYELVLTYMTMIRSKVIFDDIYFRNYGFVDNKLLCFDYHQQYYEKPKEFDVLCMIKNVIYTYKGAFYDDFFKDVNREYEDYLRIDFDIPGIPQYVRTYLKILHSLQSQYSDKKIDELEQHVKYMKTQMGK